MPGTIDTSLEQRRDQRAQEAGVKPENAKGKEAPDTRGPLADEEPGDDDEGRGRD